MSKAKVIKPIIESQEHILEKLIKTGEDPVLTSVGIAKVAGGWISFVLKSRGLEIVSCEVSDPDMKLIAYDAAKIEFVNRYLGDEYD